MRRWCSECSYCRESVDDEPCNSCFGIVAGHPSWVPEGCLGIDIEVAQ